MTKVAAILTTLLLTGCAAGTTTVTQVDVQNSQIYMEDYNTVWESTIDWLASGNIPLDKVDKESGLISSRYALAANNEYLNCGEPTGQVGAFKARFEGIYGNINIIVRDKEAGVKVTASVFGGADVVLRNGYGNVVSSASVQCYTNGMLERDLLRSIGQ